MKKGICEICGTSIKPWFKLCYDCSIKEKQRPKCEVCGSETQEGHDLCLEHWKEKQNEKKSLKKIEFIENKKKLEFREKYEGKYDFNCIPFKSKSEVIIYLFLIQNNLHPFYEETINFNGHSYHPDFILEDGDNTIILEHFGKKEVDYINIMNEKIEEYKKLCKEHKHFYFIWTTEEDLTNLKVKLGSKLNKTPLLKPRWK